VKITGIPLRAPKNKHQGISLNLNCFRNSHYQVNNKIKKYIEEIVAVKCKGKTTPDPPLKLTYRIFRKSRRKADLANIGSVLDKFVSDGLVLCGVIPDDNTNIIKCVVFEDGGVDKANPRADLLIEKYQPAG